MKNIIEKLYDHQIKALELFQKYKRSHSNKSCLINMPTGTGKSGIIAIISQYYYTNKSVIIISPRVTLADQIKKDVQRRFFVKALKINNYHSPKKVRRLGSLIPIDQEPFTIVSTIQKLLSLKKQNVNYYNKLIEKIELVIFDEGHYEPAISWSKIVRELSSKRVLFTATPYRNDFKLFDIDPKYIYSFRYEEACERKIVRKVKFIQSNYSKNNFAREFLKTFKAIPKNIQNLRSIVRCNSISSINRIHFNLSNLNQKAIAIHDRYSKEDSDNKITYR